MARRRQQKAEAVEGMQAVGQGEGDKQQFERLEARERQQRTRSKDERSAERGNTMHECLTGPRCRCEGMKRTSRAAKRNQC